MYQVQWFEKKREQTLQQVHHPAPKFSSCRLSKAQIHKKKEEHVQEGIAIANRLKVIKELLNKIEKRENQPSTTDEKVQGENSDVIIKEKLQKQGLEQKSIQNSHLDNYERLAQIEENKKVSIINGIKKMTTLITASGQNSVRITSVFEQLVVMQALSLQATVLTHLQATFITMLNNLLSNLSINAITPPAAPPAPPAPPSLPTITIIITITTTITSTDGDDDGDYEMCDDYNYDDDDDDDEDGSDSNNNSKIDDTVIVSSKCKFHTLFNMLLNHYTCSFFFLFSKCLALCVFYFAL